MSTFDPNADSSYEWGTYIPVSRKPAWKAHRRKSDATNAYNRASTATLYRRNAGGWEEVESKAPIPPKPAPKPAPVFSFQTTRQRELMRVVLDRFAEFEKRQQHFYALEGMSTSHLTLKAIGDTKTLYAFWPPEHRKYSRDIGGQVFLMEDDTLTRVQSEIRKDIDKLSAMGYIEKVGNEHERRWRPAKHLKGVTL